MSSQQLPSDIKKALKELQQSLEQIYGEQLRGIYLYGSYARGDFHPDSDVDVLIVLDGEVKPTQEIDRINHQVANICLDHNILIATFPVSEKWFKERKSPFFENVRQEGVLL